MSKIEVVLLRNLFSPSCWMGDPEDDDDEEEEEKNKQEEDDGEDEGNEGEEEEVPWQVTRNLVTPALRKTRHCVTSSS